jgi:hypothetical protein
LNAVVHAGGFRVRVEEGIEGALLNDRSLTDRWVDLWVIARSHREPTWIVIRVLVELALHHPLGLISRIAMVCIAFHAQK